MTDNRPQSPTEDTCSQNIQRLLKHAYAPETPDEDFATRVAASLQAAAVERAATVKTSQATRGDAQPTHHHNASPANDWQTVMLRVGSIAALFIVAAGMFYGLRPATDTFYRDGDLVWIDGRAYTPAEMKGTNGFVPAPTDRIHQTTADVMRLVSTRGLTPRPLPDPPTLHKVAIGDTIATGATTRRRVTLPDGSVLYVNVNSEARIVDNRHVSVERGEVFVEVNPTDELDTESGQESPQRFVLTTPGQQIVALGTKFAVDVRQQATRVQVTQGKVAVSPITASEMANNASPRESTLATTLLAGQQLTTHVDAPADIAPAPPAAHELEWTRELAAAARSPLVPSSKHTGGSLVVVDTQGQDVKLSLRTYHVDVYIEDGFARTTIDQTFFNHMPLREEGTFYFPLPPDASLSRLAMYVNGKLMEGGMAERDYARQVFETIKYRQLDPALLEWVDGSTFKMRVFPLEPRQEKRILISYTQRLPEMFGQLRYHFPAGHTMDQVRHWSAHIKVRHGDHWQWQSVSHTFNAKTEQGDLILTADAHDVRPDRDLLLELTPPPTHTPNASPLVNFAAAFHDGGQYLQLRYWPHFSLPPRRERRDWILLFEATGDRDPIVARAQVEILRSLLENAEHHDTFSLLTVGTRMHAWRPQASDATPENITEAIAWLEDSHLVGALDIERAYRAVAPLVDNATSPTIVHCGSAVPILGERDDSRLVELLPRAAEFVGVGVGKRWNRDLMKLAAERSGGFYTQINPDDDVSWRAFELLGKLNAPRLVNVTVTADNHADGESEFRLFETSLSAGESICAIARYESSATLPTQVTVRGQLDGQPFVDTIPVQQVAPRAEHLPRMWAKLEIQRLSALGLLENRDRIIALSKSMYVMSPFTSLLVLENDAMYEQYQVDRGRQDHWAMYDAPREINVVKEPTTDVPVSNDASDSTIASDTVDLATTLSRVHVRVPIRLLEHPGHSAAGGYVTNAWNCLQGIHASPVVNVQGVPNHFWGYNAADEGFGLGLNFAQPYFLSSGFASHGTFSQPPIVASFARPTILTYDYVDAVQRTNNGLVDLSVISLNGRLPELRYLYDSVDFTPVSGSFFRQIAQPRLALRESHRRASLANNLKQIGLAVHNYHDTFRAFPPTRIRNFTRSDLPTVRWTMPSSDYAMGWGPVTEGISFFDRRVRTDWININPFEFGAWDVDSDGNGIYGSVWLDLNGSRSPYGSLFLDQFTPDSSSIHQYGAPTDSRNLVTLRQALLRQLSERIEQRISWQPPLYQRPAFGGNLNVFSDLLSFAPGMNTSLIDVSALTHEERAAVSLAKLGHIDPAAREQIDRARGTGWRRIDFASDGLSRGVIICNGKGQFRLQRRTIDGLRELIICDGEQLWHLYPELGVGAKRSMSRAYRQWLSHLVPWYVPPVEDLAFQADVVELGPHTIGIIPHTDKRDADTPKDEATLSATIRVEYEFTSGDQLHEIRWTAEDSERPLGRVTLDDQGPIRVLDQEGREFGRASLRRTQVGAPSLHVDPTSLVIVPMPIRDRQTVISDVRPDVSGNEKTDDEKTVTFAEWDEEAALRLIAADLGVNNSELVEIITQRFLGRGDRRIGFYTLLLSSMQTWDPESEYESASGPIKLDPTFDHPEDPLARYIRSQLDVSSQGASRDPASLDGPADSFVVQLAEFRRQYIGWSSQRFARGEPSRVAQRLDRLADYCETCDSPRFAWSLVAFVNRKQHDLESWQRQARIYQRIEELGVFGEAATYEYARALLNVSRCENARRLPTPPIFGVDVGDRCRELYTQAIRRQLDSGQMPQLDNDVYIAFSGTEQRLAEFGELMREATQLAVDSGHRPTAITLAWQLRHVGATKLADDACELALSGVLDEERLGVTLAAVDYLWHGNQHERAATMLEQLTEIEEYQSLAELWHLAAVMAGQRGRLAESLRYDERAVELEYENLPEQVDLAVIRARYGDLLNRYEQLATAVVTLDQRPPQSLIDRVIRTADRWRSLDDEVTPACESAARILHLLGATDLAWDYLTTPLAHKPNEAQPWLNLAKSLADRGEFEFAGQAYHAAFQAEGSNAQILWDHAKLLERQGRFTAARELYQQIAAGDWQPRFDALKLNAQVKSGKR